MKKTPEKKITQETCPDRGSNPGPLRDRRACYRLTHSGGQETYTVWAQSYKTTDEGQRDALPWTYVTLSTSNNKCHEWTSGCESTSVTDKVNMGDINTLWAQYLPKGRGLHCHGRTSSWAPPITSVINGRQVEHLLWTRVWLQVAESRRFRTHV